MKKIYVKYAFVAAFAFIAGYGVYISQQKESMSDLAMANVEALANEVSIYPDCQAYCYECPGWDCIVSWGSDIEGVTCLGYRKR
jgi:hypothetical protein